MRILLAILVTAALLLAELAEAKLAPTTMKDLVKESDLIVVAVPRTLTRDSADITKTLRAGHAELQVLEVIKGSYDAKDIRIEWGDEVHDQAIDSLYERRLLFLKKDKDKWQPAHYGRSYWALEQLRDLKDKYAFATRVVYPVQMVKMDGTKLVRDAKAIDPSTYKDAKVKAVFLDDLKAYVKAQPH